jgi:UDP-N-acetylmuramate--alanine ligase
MSALARYFMSKGIPVSGYDRTPSPLTTSLINEGAQISFIDKEISVKTEVLEDDNTLYIYTPAIPKDNKILNLLKHKQKKLYKRAEILGFLSKEYQTIGIAGTHGKTTVSTITAHIMNTSHLGCQAFLGGISKNYHSNLITHTNSQWMVVEADEYGVTAQDKKIA